jgi:hypothetical protein
MHEHKVGDCVQFFADCESEPEDGTITAVHGDGHTCCIDVKCPDTGEVTHHEDVPHGKPADGGSGPYFLCHGES